MHTLSSPAEVQLWSRGERRQGRELGFVPTMGALHAGHYALVERAVRENDSALVSIFVNPLQFEDPKDLQSYPSTREEDLAGLEARGVQAVFLGATALLYPSGFQSFVEPRGCAVPLEGARRPGHFRGVATIVLKLLMLAGAQRAYFGEKDFQQLRVIEALARDMHLETRIVGHPIVRCSDGLAMSSRNRRLTPPARALATTLFHALRAACDAWAGGERQRAALEKVLASELDAHPGVEREYACVVDPRTLEPWSGEGVGRALLAARIGGVRLIDNAALDEAPQLGEGGS